MKADLPPKKRLVLLDAHALLHRAYHALPDFSSDTGEPTGALYGFVTMTLKMAKDLSPDYVFACFDLPEPTHRHEAFTAYKATRAAPDDALISQLNRSRDLCRALAIPIFEKPGFEADDLIGTICAKYKKNSDVEIIIVSGDMDTLQLVEDPLVKVYTLKKGIKETILYDEEKVRERYGFCPALVPDFKGLSGDPSDNIPGVPGIGEKTATALIGAFGSLEDIYLTLEETPERFKEEGIKPRTLALLTEHKDEAFFSKELASIRLDAPIDAPFLEKSWRESIEREKAEKLFRELGFRSLTGRLMEFLGTTGISKEESDSALVGQSPPLEAEEETQDVRTVKETAIALSLLNSDLANPSVEDILAYAHTKNFAEAREIILRDLHEKELARVFEDIERPLIPVLEAMEARGIKIDRAYIAELTKRNRSDLVRLEEQIFAYAGEAFNISSPKQLGDILFDRLGLSVKGLKKTEGGARSTRESELEKLRDSHPIIGLVLEYREIQKLLSTYLEVLPALADAEDRIHTHFLQIGATTGRMSSQNPNVQNIPIRTERGRALRKAFIAEEGFVLLACDYSQIELRIAAFLSGDEKLIETFQSGADVHRTVAAEVFGVPPEEVSDEMRREAKAINFGILYGMGANALAIAIGGTRTDAQKFLDEYFKKFPHIREYLESVKTGVALAGYTKTFFGRRRYFPALRSPLPYVRAQAERMAINAPIQGTSADIIKIAMARIAMHIEKEGIGKDAFLLLQVHDELVFEVREEMKDTFARAVVSLMEGVIPLSDTHGVPLRVDAKVGKNWGEMTTISDFHFSKKYDAYFPSSV